MITLERNLIRPKDSVYFKISINLKEYNQNINHE